MTLMCAEFPHWKGRCYFSCCVQTYIIDCCVTAYCSICPPDAGCGDGHQSLSMIPTLVSWAICNWFAIVCSLFYNTIFMFFLCDLALSNCYLLTLLCCAFSMIQYYRYCMCPVLNKKEWSCHAAQRAAQIRSSPQGLTDTLQPIDWIGLRTYVYTILSRHF